MFVQVERNLSAGRNSYPPASEVEHAVLEQVIHSRHPFFLESGDNDPKPPTRGAQTRSLKMLP